MENADTFLPSEYSFSNVDYLQEMNYDDINTLGLFPETAELNDVALSQVLSGNELLNSIPQTEPIANKPEIDDVKPSQQIKIVIDPDTFEKLSRKQVLATSRKQIPSNENEINVSRSSRSQNPTKNALAARENRMKKKHYVNELESNYKKLQTEIKCLAEKTETQERLIESLRGENKYLKSVLANEKEISALLKSVKQTPGVVFDGSSLTRVKEEDVKPRKRSLEEGDVQPKKRKNAKRGSVETGEEQRCGEEVSGVCLHVSRGHVSLEFCPTCSSRASGKEGSPDDWSSV